MAKKGRRATTEERILAVQLMENGKSPDVVAEMLGVGRTSVFEWQQKYRPDLVLMVSVNLSGKHFQQATLIEEVAEVIRKTGIDPAHLILEITESVVMEGAESTIETLTKSGLAGVNNAFEPWGSKAKSAPQEHPLNALEKY